MAFLSSLNIVASGMTAQQLRLDVVAENVTNSTTTRTEAGGPYRRKMVVFQSVAGRDDFRAAMARAAGGLAPNTGASPAGGTLTLQSKTGNTTDLSTEALVRDQISVTPKPMTGSSLTLQIGDTSDSWNQLQVSVEAIK